MPAFSVRKSQFIHAPIDKVFATVRDFRKWPEWSPWLISEPDCRLDFAADGMSYSWDGKIIGSGNIAVDNEKAPRSIDHKIHFLKPFKSKADVQFTFAEKDGGTEVSWTMDSSLPFFLFFLKKLMTALIGNDYERGLHMLKDHLETGSVPSRLDFPGRGEFPGCRYVGIETECPTADIGPSMGRDLKKLGEWKDRSETKPSGPPFSIYHRWDLVKGIVRYTIAFPVEPGERPVDSPFVTGELPACPVYKVVHTGRYSHLGNAWSAGYGRSRAKVFSLDKKIPVFEIYESDPAETAEEDLVTVLHFPAK